MFLLCPDGSFLKRQALFKNGRPGPISILIGRGLLGIPLSQNVLFPVLFLFYRPLVGQYRVFTLGEGLKRRQGDSVVIR